MQVIWDFFEKQVFSLQWLEQLLSNMLVFFGLDIKQRLGASILFFLFDSIKIFLLLSFLVFIISYIESYFPPERTKKILGNLNGFWARLIGALLGTVTPFCSCSSIPIFMGFTNAGLPIGVTFSFLISSPLVDIAAFVLLMGVFGFNVAMIYVVSGIVLAVIGGTIIDKLKLQDQIEPFMTEHKACCCGGKPLTPKDRIRFSFQDVFGIIKKVWLYILLGVGIGAAIHNYVPKDYIQSVLGENNPFSVILATIVGIPIYSEPFGTIPIAEALFSKGVPIGTIIAFMMGVITLSLPSLIMLKKVVKTKLLSIFVLIVTVGIILVGYMFNFLQPYI